MSPLDSEYSCHKTAKMAAVQSWLHLAVMAVLIAATSAGTATNRFGALQPSLSCRIGVSNPSNIETKVAEGRQRDARSQSFFDSCVLGLDHLNCTIVYMDGMLIGTADENGTFDGTLGFMQRDEIDFGFPATRLDTLGADFIQVGPVLSAADMIIISMPKPAERINLDLWDVLDTMTSSFKAYLCIVIAIVVTALLLLECRFELYQQAQLLEVLNKIIWCVSTLFVGQCNYGTKGKTALRMLWSIFALVVWIIVYGYLVNCMSVNEVARKPVETIDSIDGHLSARFDHVEPIVFENSISYPLLATADTESTLGRLYSKAEVNQKDNIVNPGSCEPDTLSRVFERVFESNDMASLILDRFSWDTSIRGVMCGFGAEHVTQVHESRDSFANGIMASYFNKRSPPGFTRYAEYRFRILAEALLPQQSYRHMTENILMSSIGAVPSAVLQCWDKDKMAEVDKSVTPTSFKVMKKTVQVYGMALSLATLVLAIERVVHSQKDSISCQLWEQSLLSLFHRWHHCSA